MKKLTVTLSNSTITNIEEFHNSVIDTISDADLITLGSTIKSLSENGDIWFKHYYLDNDKCHLLYIFDSEDALTNFSPAKAVLESLEMFDKSVDEDLTFEQFADLASQYDETFIPNNRVDALLSTE